MTSEQSFKENLINQISNLYFSIRFPYSIRYGAAFEFILRVHLCFTFN